MGRRRDEQLPASAHRDLPGPGGGASQRGARPPGLPCRLRGVPLGQGADLRKPATGRSRRAQRRRGGVGGPGKAAQGPGGLFQHEGRACRGHEPRGGSDGVPGRRPGDRDLPPVHDPDPRAAQRGKRHGRRHGGPIRRLHARRHRRGRGKLHGACPPHRVCRRERRGGLLQRLEGDERERRGEGPGGLRGARHPPAGRPRQEGGLRDPRAAHPPARQGDDPLRRGPRSNRRKDRRHREDGDSSHDERCRPCRL